MLSRCMIILLLFMTFAAPSWANEKDTWLNDLPPSIDERLEAAKKHEQEKNRSPLAKLCIESEAWHEGSTQYIRYTFTNPTDTLIQQKIAYTDISYVAFTTAKQFDHRIYSTDAIRELIIKPHSSISKTFAIPQNAPIIFVNHSWTTFYLNESDFIDYHSMTQTPSDSVSFVLTPTRLPNGEFALSLENRTSSEVNSELRDVSISTKLSSEKYPTTSFIGMVTIPKPIPFSVKPHEIISIPIPIKFYKYENKTKIDSAPFETINIDNDFTIKLSLLTAKIDDNYYERNLPLFSAPITYESKPPATTEYRKLFRQPYSTPIKVNGAYQVDDNTLTTYIRLTNTTDDPLSLEKTTLSLSLTYLTTNSTSHTATYTLTTSEQLSLAKQQDSHLSFSIPLPNDTAAIPIVPTAILVAHTQGTAHTHSDSEYLTEKVPNNLQKTSYTYLGEASLELIL